VVEIAAFYQGQWRCFFPESIAGQGVEPGIKKEMQDFLENRQEIEQVYNIITLQLGDGVMVAIKARMSHSGSEQKWLWRLIALKKNSGPHSPRSCGCFLNRILPTRDKTAAGPLPVSFFQ